MKSTRDELLTEAQRLTVQLAKVRALKKRSYLENEPTSTSCEIIAQEEALEERLAAIKARFSRFTEG